MLQLRKQLLRNSLISTSIKTLRKSSAFVASETNNGNHETSENAPPLDEYTAEFQKNHIQISPIQRAILSVGSSLAALLDPTRHDMIACCGETTGELALRNLLTTMQNDEEGRRVLADKPRINTSTVDIDRLRKMPTKSLGYAYVKFLDDNKVTPDSRMEVRFIDDPELAYVMTRYRECHDLVHALLGMPTNMLGEVAVKWVEALNTGLPMCYGGAVFGAIRLRPKQRQNYLNKYLPWAIENGKNAKSLLTIYWEKRWEQDISKLQEEYRITPFIK